MNQHDRYYRVLEILGQEIDGWGDRDVHEEAILVAMERGIAEPGPAEYAEALVRCILGDS